jgi:hypothetical protein
MSLKRVKISRKCDFCGSRVEQGITFREIEGKITLVVWRDTCPSCKIPLKKPTPMEIKRAMILREKGSQ